LLLESGAPDGSDSLLLLIDWEADELVGLTGSAFAMAALRTGRPPRSAVTRVMRGPLTPGAPPPRAPRRTVELRVLLDGSAVEVYMSTGVTLSTRVHLHQEVRVCHVVSVGPGATGMCGQAWAVRSMWREKGATGAAPSAGGGNSLSMRDICLPTEGTAGGGATSLSMSSIWIPDPQSSARPAATPAADIEFAPQPPVIVPEGLDVVLDTEGEAVGWGGR